MLWISPKHFRVKLSKIFAEGMDQGPEEMIGIDKSITRDEVLVKAEMVLHGRKP